MTRSRTMLLVAVLTLTVAAVAPGPSAAGQTAPPPPDGLGPWAVGLTTVELTDGSRDGRTLTVDVWYPVDPEDTAGASQASLDLLFASLPLDDVLADPEPSGAGPFPLVVFSHGSGGVRYQSFFLLRALASHGFVVAAPDHVGNTAVDSVGGTTDPFPVIAENRPRDVSFVIDELLGQNADRTDPLAPLVDPHEIAVAGHSFGGYTSLAVAGGYDDYAPDPRVDAIVPLAAATGPLSDAEIAAIDVPVMLISGTEDVTVPISGSTERIWSLLQAEPRYRGDIVDAGHNSFTDVCAFLDAYRAVGAPDAVLGFVEDAAEEGCAPELIPLEEAQDLTTLFTVAFLKVNVVGDTSFNRFLAPSYVEGNDLPVNYRVQPDCADLAPTIVGSGLVLGTPGDDVIVGSDGDDVIRGLGGDDVICGLGGDDRLYGDAGDDTVLGGDGDDEIYGAGGEDVLSGVGGDDLLVAGGGDDVVDAGPGDDTAFGGPGGDTLIGGAGDDQLDGAAGNDLVIDDVGGANVLAGGGGNDFLAAGPGDDTLKGGEGDDVLLAGGGADILLGGPGADELDGEVGPDALWGGPGEDVCILDGIDRSGPACEVKLAA